MNQVNNAFVFLLNTLRDLYLYILILRFILPIIRADYYNPLSQLTLQLTNPLVKPLQKIIPNFKNINISVLIIIFLLNSIMLIILHHAIPGLGMMIFYSIWHTTNTVLSMLFFMIIVTVIASWVSPMGMHPIIKIFHDIVDPYLSLFRKFIPMIAGFDFSPVAAIIGLQLLNIILIDGLRSLYFG